MQFKLSLVAFLATTTAIAAPVPAGKEASCASDAINVLSVATSEISSLTKTLDGNGNLIEVGQSAVSGLTNHAGTILKRLSLPCGSNLSKSEQEQLCSAAELFIDQDEALVKAFDSQKGILKNTPFVAPLAAAIRTIEAATGEYFDPIVAATPLCGGNLQQLVQTLQDDISQLVGMYSMLQGAPSLPLQGPGSGAESGNPN
ncbi:hypothetical protein N7510_010806 [Penicillium lagena]|uniref:uncharacterized protein n=1 Tax=Penicillium lagena TaxID=94218 RepID=UPI0025404ADA|nr:uncharacterized protein N7510_010806 [Penicillium lagena]KAJ5601272.1 hypothetical protein N7510_010806 [Penicillium lagena]